MSTVAAVPPGTTFSGTRLIDSGKALSQAIQNGDWLDGGVALMNTLGDAAAALSDPIGTIVNFGLGWVMEYLKPLSTWLEKLTGSEANVTSVASQWASAGSSLGTTAATLDTRLGDLEGLTGGTVTAYIRFARDAARHLGASGEWAVAASTGLASASGLVSKMQGVVKQAISQVIATAIEAMAVVAATMGLGMGYAIARVVMKVNQMVNKVVRPLTQVVTSVKTLTGLVQKLKSLFDDTSTQVTGLLRGSPERIAIDAGAVVDASAATAFGNSAQAEFLRRARVADAVTHENTPVAALASADATLTADGATVGTTSLGGVGGGAAGGSSIGLGTGAHLAAGSNSVNGSAVAGGVGVAANTAAAMQATSGTSGMRMPMAMNPVAGGGGGEKPALGLRRRQLRVVVERDGD